MFNIVWSVSIFGFCFALFVKDERASAFVGFGTYSAVLWRRQIIGKYLENQREIMEHRHRK